ncbi:hypothetical protein EOD39_7072 [Acipenser ruthenus]|uniref:Centrosomal protein 43 n=1 Tax=Acipenser ruthenus TaxID=7906 RepID=A0A662YXS4_ACIRT|nr:hypothetical protein EOD39_7072 [Acipenser ruthenus]
MSAAEEDTELRDLLIQNLENSGVLNKLKAELRAAVFLALEEQEKVENKTPLFNESLKKFLNTKDGRLVASLLSDFLQFFNLDFTMAVFQPEINTDRSGEISKEELRTLFTDLFPYFHKNMLEMYITDEFRAVEKDFNNSIDFDQFLRMYKRLFIQCRSVVIESSLSELSVPTGGVKNKSNVQISANESKLDSKRRSNVPAVKKGEDFDLDDEKDEDSFFDDPLPKPEKTYGRITGKNNDTDEETEDPFAENGNRHNPEERTDSSRPMGSLASLSDAPPLKTGLGSLAGVPPLKGPYDRDEDDDYDDDFNSISHRSDKTKSEVSIGEEIEEELSTEGVDFNASDKLDDLTLDRSISQFSEAVDYMEEVA